MFAQPANPTLNNANVRHKHSKAVKKMKASAV